MIKFLSFDSTGTTKLVVGLSEANVKRMQDGHPARFNLKEMLAIRPEGEAPFPTPDEVYIFAGTDEVSMVKELVEGGLLPEEAVRSAEQAMRDRTSVEMTGKDYS